MKRKERVYRERCGGYRAREREAGSDKRCRQGTRGKRRIGELGNVGRRSCGVSESRAQRCQRGGNTGRKTEVIWGRK